MKNTLILIVSLLSFFKCYAQPNPNVWTAKYEHGFYHYLDSISKRDIPDSVKRTKYVLFTIKRLKEEIPNGLNSVSKDSLHNLNIRIGGEYAIHERKEGNYNNGIIPYFTPWSPVIEKTFRNDFLAVFKNLDIKIVNKFCDCVIEELKKTYPDSILVPVPDAIMAKTAVGCKYKSGIN